MTTLLVFFVTLGLSVYLFVIIPKGFFPQQDNGMILGTSEAAQDISFDEMKQQQEELGQIVLADPGRRTASPCSSAAAAARSTPAACTSR